MLKRRKEKLKKKLKFLEKMLNNASWNINLNNY